MKILSLVNTRKIVSILFLLITSVVFLDIIHVIPASYYDFILYFQFIPSITKFTYLFSITAAGFVVVIILVLLFGRVYCSSVCPIGTVQDISSYIAKKIRRRKRYGYRKELKWLRYIILLATVISFVSGGLIVLNLLDPYSNYGRILSQIFNPALIGINNLLAFSLEKLNIYWIYPIEVKDVSYLLAIFPLIFFLIIIYLSFTRGRIYCNTICPVGTLLGLLSKFSFFKLKIDETSCEGCGACALVCKSECIDKINKRIDFDRCVACYNCIKVCPSVSISYRSSLSSKNFIDTGTDESKRDFIFKSLIYLAGLTGIADAQTKIIPKKESKVPVIRKSVSSPPGSNSIEHFNASCTACNLCVAACPTKVLQPSFLEYGFLGILQPYMDYKTSFCNFECTVCSEVCPTGAIQLISLERKKITQIGKTVFVKENCIVETENTACGACSEHCPTKAVHMIDYKNGLKIPELRNKFCVGCGACEFACPTKPYKAIYVEGNEIHQWAEKNVEEKLDKQIDLKKDFPF